MCCSILPVDHTFYNKHFTKCRYKLIKEE